MKLTIAVEQTQKLNLTAGMRQSLEFLQLSAPELAERIQDAALSNPVLEVEMPSPAALSLNEVGAPEEDLPWEQDELFRAERPHAGSGDYIERLALAQGETLTEHLTAQLRQSALLDGALLTRALYLVECLDERGYLTIPLDVLADELGCTAFELEQALFAVQMLDPPGVGARDLTECLILQLAQGPELNALTLRMAREGLPLLAARQYGELAKRFHADSVQIRNAAHAIASLNPIPSRGFGSGSAQHYVIPDANVSVENGQLTVGLNDRALPRVSIRPDYAGLLESTDDCEVRQYIRGKLSEANSLIGNLQNRAGTLAALLRALVQYQSGYFLRGDGLRPLTMQQMADALQVNVSTVSRAAQGKALQFGGKVLPLRSFFTTAVSSAAGAEISNDTVKQKIAYLIAHEDPLTPLSDDAIRLALEGMNIRISRRTVAKYRTALELPPANLRKRETHL